MPGGSYVKTMPWGQQKPPLGYGIDWGNPFAPTKLCVLHNEQYGQPHNLVDINQRAVSSGNPLWMVKSGMSGRNYGNVNDLDTYITPMEKNSPITAIITACVDDALVSIRKRAIRLYGSAGTSVYIEFSDSYVNVIQAGLQYSTGGSFELVRGPGYTANTKYTVAVRWSPGRTVDLYVNGLWNASSADTRTSCVDITNTTLGSNTAGGLLHLRGLIDNAFVYNRALSANEIASLYAEPYQMIEGWNYGRFFSVPSGVVYYGSLIGDSALVSNGVLVGGGLVS